MTSTLSRSVFRLPAGDPRCGTPSGYNAGCGCGPCVDARAAYVARRKDPRPPSSLGAYADIALLLGVTSNQVYMWYQRRARNGFPEPRGTRKRGMGTVRVFDLNEVLTWYVGYEPSKGGAPRGARNPSASGKRARRTDGTFA
jgi:hypothetical protein